MYASLPGAAQIYHSEDSIAELRIRVRLGPRRDAETGDPENPDNPSQEGEEEIFWWRERVLGEHETTEETSSGARQGHKLFSRFIEAGAVETQDADDNVDTPSHGHMLRRCFAWWQHRAYQKRDVWEDVLSLCPCDRMQLLAALKDPVDAPGALDEASDEQHCEVLLCELRSYNDGHVLESWPPFCATGEHGFQYRCELPSGAYYEYCIENISHVPLEEERRQALESKRSFDACAPHLRSNLAGSGFESLKEASTQLTIVGEIVSYEPSPCIGALLEGDGDIQTASASDMSVEDALTMESPFRCTRPASMFSVLCRPSFYVICEMSLPSGREWGLAKSTGHAFGNAPICTHYASLSGRYALHQQCIFNHPIELHLAHTPQSQVFLSDSQHDPVPPRIVFQLLRIDSWDRHVLHGYSFLDIPQQPGAYDIPLRLWAPVGTITQQLDAKFCGMSLPLASIHLCAVADMHRRDGLPRNRSALRSRTAAGILHVRLQVARQHRLPDSEHVEEPSTDILGRPSRMRGARRRRQRRNNSDSVAELMRLTD